MLKFKMKFVYYYHILKWLVIMVISSLDSKHLPRYANSLFGYLFLLMILGWLSFWIHLERWSILWRKRMVPKWFSDWFKNFDSYFVMLARHSFASRSFGWTWCTCFLWTICPQKDGRWVLENFNEVVQCVLGDKKLTLKELPSRVPFALVEKTSNPPEYYVQSRTEIKEVWVDNENSRNQNFHDHF